LIILIHTFVEKSKQTNLKTNQSITLQTYLTVEALVIL